jgi:hypothetical protein
MGKLDDAIKWLKLEVGDLELDLEDSCYAHDTRNTFLYILQMIESGKFYERIKLLK